MAYSFPVRCLEGLYSAASSIDGGTLYQLRNIINCRNITSSPSGNVTASEKFFLLVTEAHVLAAAMTVFGMRSLDKRPHDRAFPPECEKQPSQDRRRIQLNAIDKLLSHFIDLKFCNQGRRWDTHNSLLAIFSFAV